MNNTQNKIQTPNWVKHAIFYQIFPDRFQRSQISKTNFKNLNFEPWDSPPNFHGYKGGDLWGIIERMDYLVELGINAIYLNPVFQSASVHRYHTYDYYNVDPILGGNEALKSLINEAHKRDIKIILDGVFNHASRGFFAFHDILENKEKSPWINWFIIKRFPLIPYQWDKESPVDPNYQCWWNLPALPEFNHDNPDVREYLMKVGEYWIKLGIDGWRLDVPGCIKAQRFWQEFRERIKKINPEAYIVGEIWENAQAWLDGTQFDGVMNYLFTGAIYSLLGNDFINEQLLHNHFKPYKTMNAHQYADRIQWILSLYPWEIQLTQLNLLDSHDTARFLTIMQNNKHILKLAWFLLMTYPGAPCIYYGDEIGMDGGADPECRKSFYQENLWDLDLLNTLKTLISIRKQNNALKIGSYKVIDNKDKAHVFARILGDEILICGINVSNTIIELSFKFDVNTTKLTVPNKVFEINNGSSLVLTNNNGTLKIPSMSAVIFKL